MSRDEVLGLVVERVAMVLARPVDEITESARLGEDLHADSLDLVEVVEGVESAMAERGSPVSLSDEDLRRLSTVGEAADVIALAAAAAAADDGARA